MMRAQGRSLTPLSSSRSSLVGVGSMPIIAENEVALSPPASPTATLFGSINSSPPLRIPQKNPRRGGGPGSLSPSPSPSPPAGANRNSAAGSLRGLPPPYVPPYILEPPTLHPPPPRYTKEDAEIAEQGERQQEQQQDEVEADELGGTRRRGKMADRWCCVLGVVVALLVVVAVGLAIGLTVGLKDK